MTRLVIEGRVFYVPLRLPMPVPRHLYEDDFVFPTIPAPPPPERMDTPPPPPPPPHPTLSAWPPGFLVPASNITPGPFSPPIAPYTRAVVQAAARQRALEERGILVYIEEAAHAIMRWLGMADPEEVEEDYELEEVHLEEQRQVIIYRPFFYRAINFLFRALGLRRRW